MRFNGLVLAVSAATALTIPAALAAGEPKENQPSWESACFDEDGPCNALQQAATAARDSLGSDLQASAELDDISCYAKGAPCNVAKREALALAEAVAEAYAMALPKAASSLQDRSYQSTDGEGEVDNASAHPFRDAEGTAGLEKLCSAYGDPCHADAAKVKRAVDVLARATKDFNRDLTVEEEKHHGKKHHEGKQHEGKQHERRFSWKDWKMKWCHEVGEPCFKVKRAFEHLDAFLKA